MISTRYLIFHKVVLPIVETVARMGKFFPGLCAVIVPYKRGVMGSDE